MKGVIKWLWIMTVLGIWVEVNGCLEQEKAALLQLKKNVGDQLPFIFRSVWLLDYLESWKEDKTSNCCDDWEGVTCGLNSRVVSLSLESPNLGHLSEMHFNASVLHPFEELRELNLTSMGIKSWDEDKGASKLSSKLKSLESLNLQYNNFDASSLSQLHGFLSLKYLFLDENNLEGLQLHDIEAISQNLEELGLRGTEITGFQNNNGSTKLSSSLKVLDLSQNMLDNNIISQLSGFQSLHTLNLRANQLRGVVPLKGSTNLSSSLKVLDLSYTTLDNNIISQLSGFQSLHTLYLRHSQLSGNVPINALHQLRHLEVLDLSENNINGVSNYNASFNGGLTSLQELYLSYNQLAGEIPLWLLNFTSLETLDLSHNQLIGNIGSSLLIHLFSLKYLTLSDNHLQIPDSFQSFANHTNLKYFVGDSNQVVHVSKQDFRPPFPLGLQLQELSLSDCALFTYPPFLSHQRDLRFVDLSRNLLQEEFPTWLLENNLKLDTLILSNNSFTGSLQLPSLTHTLLRRIWVAQNKIQGHIPSNIGVIFPNLVELDLSNNRLTGNFPLSLSDLQSLEGLYLSNNRLSGEIDHLSKSLKSLDLSINDFEGELPSFNGLLSLIMLKLQGNNFSSGLQRNRFGPVLEVVNLSNNSLEGPIPNHICRNLFSLDLSFNRLNGLMPVCSNIEFLYLNNNNLRGHLSDEFLKDAPYLVFLDLSNNDLSGYIPAGIGNLTQLEALLLRGNQIHGRIPLQLCNLVSMNILDLSSNNLHGPIPTCLSQIATSSFVSENAGISIDFGRIGEDILLENLIGSKRPLALTLFFNEVQFVTKNMAYNYKGSVLYYMSGIDLSCNQLTGHIPHELGNLSNIHALNLSHNQLWGVIPSTFSNLKNIESLDLSYNHLNGRIPPQVTNLDTLEVFNVSCNNLSGRIPFQGHSVTFDNTSYKGNPFLCGLPLPINCTTDDNTPSTNTSESQDEDSGWIDMEAFYITFAGSGVTMFLAVVIIMLINPHWWNAWFYLAKACIFSGYYFFEDIIRKLMRARRV